MNAITPTQSSNSGGHADNPFAAVANAMVRIGWSLFPQERWGARMPSKVNGRTLRWQTDHHLSDRRPTEEELRTWCAQCPAENVAVVLGKASGNAFVLDIDITDAALCAQVQAIAEEHLGPTDFRRAGRAPKIALVYRHAEGDVVASVSRTLAVGGEERQMVEVLGAGKAITFHGVHHKTGNFFRWVGDCTPITDGPAMAPEVSSGQVKAFLEAVEARFGFTRTASNLDHADWSVSDVGRIKVATVATEHEGTIVDGREDFLRALVVENVKVNVDMVRAAKGDDEATSQVAADIGAAVAAEFSRRAKLDGRWAPGALPNEVRGRVGAAVRKVQNGDLFKEYVTDEERAVREAARLEEGIRAAQELRANKQAAQDRQARQEAVAAGEEVPEEDLPFRCLGHDRGVYHFLGQGGQVRDLSEGQLAHLPSLHALAPLEYWQENYHGPKGVNVQAAANALIKESLKVGIYRPDRVRGRGAWIEGGKPILHLGDRVLVDGRYVSPSALRGKHIYENTRAICDDLFDSEHVVEELTSEEGALVVELCCSLPLKDQPGQGKLLAGWVVTAQVCGCMSWRTHACLNGEKGNGKTWALENFIQPALGGLAICAQSKTTEAGVRAALGSDARPFVIDEFDTQNKADQLRVQQIVDLARAASSENGAPIRKSTKDQREKTFSTRAQFMVSAVNLPIHQAADESRFVVFDFQLPPEHLREAQFDRLCALQAALVTPDFSARLMARSLRLVPVIRESSETLARVIARLFGSRRQGDTVGVPLAGFWSLTHETAITEEEAVALVKSEKWIADAAHSAGSQPEWRRALDYIMQVPVRVMGSNRDEDIHIGVIVDILARGSGTEAVCTAEGPLRRALAEHGIRVEGRQVVFGTGCTALSDAFADTDWGRSWAKTIGRAPEAFMCEKTKKFAGATSRALSIPLEVACPPEG
jgi:putative DNA primase/helicase